MKKKIMIVDDEKEFLEELREILEASGYDLIAVNDAGKAVEVARQIKPIVVLLDLKMPKKSGFQLANELRYFSGLERVPIIAMSAFYKQEYHSLMQLCGIRRCLAKPFQPLDVIAEIEGALADCAGGGD